MIFLNQRSFQQSEYRTVEMNFDSKTMVKIRTFCNASIFRYVYYIVGTLIFCIFFVDDNKFKVLDCLYKKMSHNAEFNASADYDGPTRPKTPF